MGFRFAASLPNVMMVLSGMSNMEQMEDNVSSMQEFQPLSDEEQHVLEEGDVGLKQFADIPCTVCHYCTPCCPAGIHIPEIFAVMNVLRCTAISPRHATNTVGVLAWHWLGPASSAVSARQPVRSTCPSSSCWQRLPIHWSNKHQIRNNYGTYKFGWHGLLLQIIGAYIVCKYL